MLSNWYFLFNFERTFESNFDIYNSDGFYILYPNLRLEVEMLELIARCIQGL